MRPTDRPHADHSTAPASHGRCVVRNLAEILADPAALQPPVVVVPRLAWRGRVTLLAAREKGGKSTLATAAAAAVTTGHAWLGEATEAGTVLWVGLEEHVSDLGGRMRFWGADARRVDVVDCLVTERDPIATVRNEAVQRRPALVVIDTLAALAEATGTNPDPGSSTAWTPIMAAITRIARDSDAAVLLLGHARKSDGKYRDSSAIGAGVDVIVEMNDANPDVRTFKVRARWPVGDYSTRLVGDRYELAGGSVSLDERVLRFIEARAGCSMRDVRGGVTGRDEDIGEAVRRLLAGGAVENRGSGSGMRLFAVSPGSGHDPNVGTASEPGPGTTCGRAVPAKPYATESGTNVGVGEVLELFDGAVQP